MRCNTRTVAALERGGSRESRDQSAQPTNARPKAGAVAASWKDWLSRNWNRLPVLDMATPSSTSEHALKRRRFRSTQEAAYTWNFTQKTSGGYM